MCAVNLPLGCKLERIWLSNNICMRGESCDYKTSVLGPGLFLLCPCVKGKHHNGAYFHSQNATVNLVCHHVPPMSPLSEKTADDN